MIKYLLFAAPVLLVALSALPGYLIKRGRARYDLESVELFRDTLPAPVQAVVDTLEAKWDAFWARNERAWRLSAKGQLTASRLADAADIRTWERDHAERTAVAFAGQAAEQRGAWDDWLTDYLHKFGFASLTEVNEAMEAQLSESVERLERDVARTDIECTATGSWTEADVAALREYEIEIGMGVRS